MQSVGLKPFTFDFQEILIDEIALEGLEGTGIDLLWARLEYRTYHQITEKMRERLWTVVINLIEKGRVELFQLPDCVPHIEIVDRFTMIDQDSGDIKDPEFFLDGPYEYCPCTTTLGSSKYYTTRKLIPLEEIKGVPLSKIINVYGCTLVLVACMEDRWRALAPHVPETCIKQLTNLQYCLLELIGKGRENGQTTFGMTNVLKVIKEPKTLFYYRKTLQNLNIIKACHITQYSNNRSVKSILLRLDRFHKPRALSLPKIGKVHDIVEYLKTMPGYMERAEEIWRKGLLTQQHMKRLRKTINIFEFHERMVQDTVSTKKHPEPHVSLRKRKFISINPQSDESSQSEGETEPPLKCQFKIGVGIMRQAAERFQDAGKKGLTQIQLGQMLGVPFYTARHICRVFRQQKIIKEFFEDRGKQRVSRFIIRTGLDNRKFDEEAKTFLKYVKENKASNDNGSTSPQPSTSQAIEIEEQDKTIDEDSANKHISEVKQFEGVKVRTNAVTMTSQLKAGNLTLRQLKFANGLLKIVKEHQCITGYQTISNMVAKEINQPPMVTKALKAFLQRLVMEGQLKVFKVRWPGVGNENKYVNVVCSPHIKATDPIVRAKYKEVYLRAMQKKHQQNIKKEIPEPPVRPLATYINPRYMKIQNLHESIIKMVYFDPLPDSIGVHKGFLTVTEFLHEITVKFAISSMSSSGLTEVAHLRIGDDQLYMKIKDAPVELGHFIIKSKSLRNSIRMCLKVLAMHGLIQLIYKPDMIGIDHTSNFLSSFTFYVNRNARIVNTTGNWPRDNVDIKTLEKSYYFRNQNDVTHFWNDVYEISVATKVLVKNRIKKKINPPLRREQDVKLYDNGDRYGDGCGPCGFDSCFFMEIPRLWHTFYVRKTKQPPLSKKKPIKVNKVTKKKAKKPKPPIAKPPKIQPVKIVPPPFEGRKRRTEHPTKWSAEEDFVIIMCLIAITITSPNSQPGSLRVRNMVAKDILSVKDPFKTQTACHRRTLALQMNPTSMHDKDCLLNEMRRRRHLIQKYEGLIKKLRLRHSTNITKFINEARVPLLELVYLIKQVSKSEFFNKRLPCIAENAEKFHNNYNIVQNTSSRAYNVYMHPELCFLRESVFFTIMLAYNNEVKLELAKKIYSIFKLYPEQSLRTVVDQLRKSGAISAKEKIFNNQMHRLHLEDIVQSAYKISAKYQQRWMSRLNTDFVVCLGRVVDKVLPVNFKGTSELNCLFSELQCSGLIELVSCVTPNVVDVSDTKLSEDHMNVLDIETKYKLKSGSVMWQPTATTYEKLEKTDDGVICTNLFKNNDFVEAIKEIESNNTIILPNQTAVLFLNDPVVQFLCEKKEQGCNFKELQDHTGYETEQLITKLKFFESKGTLKRVGYTDNYIVIMPHIKHWSLKVEDKFILVTPWINMEFEIRYDIFLEWAGVIMNKIFENPGCSVQYISKTFELITPKAIQDVCIFLKKCKCITMYSLSFEEVGLFSDEDNVPDICEYNPYTSVDKIVMFPMVDSLSKFAYLRKTMLVSYAAKQSKSK